MFKKKNYCLLFICLLFVGPLLKVYHMYMDINDTNCQITCWLVTLGIALACSWLPLFLSILISAAVAAYFIGTWWSIIFLIMIAVVLRKINLLLFNDNEFIKLIPDDIVESNLIVPVRFNSPKTAITKITRKTVFDN